MNNNSDKLITPKRAAEIFLHMYHDDDITKLKNIGAQSLNVDYYELFTHLKSYNGRNFDEILLNKPKEMIKVFTDVLNNLCETNDLNIRIESMDFNFTLKELGAPHIGKLISIKALVKNVSEIRPKFKRIMFECKNCMKLHPVEQTTEQNKEPALCQECGGRSFRMIIEESEFINIQNIKLEEPLELRTGGTTRSFIGSMEGDLADPLSNIHPGDVVNIICILKAVENGNSDKLSFILDVNNIESLISTYQDLKITNEDEEIIEKLSKDPDIFLKITNSIAPSVVGYTEIKKGLALQQFGAYDEVNIDNTIRRGFIHTLLVGDPGVAKSQLLKYISNLAPKGIYTSGASSSAVGITAAAVKDNFSGNWTIEAGTLVLADSGIACIDELDKMDEASIMALNEAMEQGSVSISKAGLVQTMNARTSVLAAANPKYSRFDKTKPIISQIQVPDSTLSRFDLVFAIEDKINEDTDRELAEDILEGFDKKEAEIIDQDILKKYIAYSRKNCNPKLEPDVIEFIKEFYVKTRKAASHNRDSKIVTPRDLEAIRRLTIARARSELKEHTTIEHAKDAILVYNHALKSVGLDTEEKGDRN